MEITVKKMETKDEILGKAFVHWTSWHETYSGLVRQDYLDKLTLEKCEVIAFQWPDGILIAKDGDKVIGFVGYGASREDADAGEIFAIYVLSAYHGTGVGQMLLSAGLEQLNQFKKISLWVIDENMRAIRFYRKNGFTETGEKTDHQNLGATVIRMLLDKQT
ncbi:MAG: GNAT family N-acetyltransferase [Clostridia bacterium]|nr:GNAT family N-acetyltransferase [Clostridia bacterium]